MKTKSKSINFGKVDHFLYVRLMCLSADLGLPLRELIQYGYYLLVELITEDGQSQFEVLYKNYKKYSDLQEKVRYAPRKKGSKHSIVVKNVHEEVYQHLVVIRKEKNYAWGMLLYVLLMAIEQELDKDKEEDMLLEERQEELEEKFDDRSF